MEIRNKKDFIIENFVKNPKMDLHKFSEDNLLNINQVNRVIKEYKQNLTVNYPIYCIKSLDLQDVYYLITEGEEKKLEVSSGIIKNNVSLTRYEKYWLTINKGFNTKEDLFEMPDRHNNFIENN
jgi:hypothetical protein